MARDGGDAAGDGPCGGAARASSALPYNATPFPLIRCPAGPGLLLRACPCGALWPLGGMCWSEIVLLICGLVARQSYWGGA